MKKSDAAVGLAAVALVGGIALLVLSSKKAKSAVPTASYQKVSTPSLPGGSTVIERFGPAGVVGIDSSGNLASYRDPVYGQDAFAPVAWGSVPTPIGTTLPPTTPAQQQAQGYVSPYGH